MRILPEYFEKNHLEVITVERKDQNLSHLLFTNQINLLTWEEARTRMDTENAQNYQKILENFGELDKQDQAGMAMIMPKLTVVGKKADEIDIERVQLSNGTKL